MVLESSGHDRVNCLSKIWMLGYSLYKILDIDVPFGCDHVIRTVFLRGGC